MYLFQLLLGLELIIKTMREGETAIGIIGKINFEKKNLKTIII